LSGYGDGNLTVVRCVLLVSPSFIPGGPWFGVNCHA
jgi:hypothetical protein